ncbi:MAG: histone deacetylase [Gemmatimonadetes bacterium]|nr:histone deacetylase [Gemmatimonadota bacterium]
MRSLDRRDFLRGTLAAASWAALPSSLTACAPRTRPTAFHYDDLYLTHDTGEDHPERPARLTAVMDRVSAAEWYPDLHQIPLRAAETSELELVHDPEYVALARTEIEGGARRLSTGDTNVSAESYRVSTHACGAVLEAVDAVMDGRAKNAFCAVRPPGHHATPDRGMGFCVFNAVAVAARYAQVTHGVERVLIVDWDVHHGNGTQDIFYADGSVFYMSTHQSPFYPGTGALEETGEGPGSGLTMNRPFAEGAGDAEVVGAFRNDLLPAALDFAPDLILISAGFDARHGDRLGGFEVTDEGFRELTRIMLEIAHVSGGGRIVSMLEGGYTPEGLASATCAHVEELVRG